MEREEDRRQVISRLHVAAVYVAMALLGAAAIAVQFFMPPFARPRAAGQLGAGVLDRPSENASGQRPLFAVLFLIFCPLLQAGCCWKCNTVNVRSCEEPRRGTPFNYEERSEYQLELPRRRGASL